MKLRIGARGSALSLAQTEIVAGALRPHAEVEIVPIRTTGDRLSRLDTTMTGKDLFTREIDDALLAGRVDVGVHSLKDLPSRLPEGIALAAVPPREDPRDVLVSRDRRPLETLPRGVRIGTSSARRRAQILFARPDAEVLEARGNVDTRVRRLKEGKWDAIVLARAGLARLGLLKEITEELPVSVMLPAVGQGALALVARADDRGVLERLAGLDHPPSHREATAERTLLEPLEAGCRAPVAGLARSGDGTLELQGAVFAPDGSRTLRAGATGDQHDPAALGREVATRLLELGAAEMIAMARG